VLSDQPRLPTLTAVHECYEIAELAGLQNDGLEIGVMGFGGLEFGGLQVVNSHGT